MNSLTIQVLILIASFLFYRVLRSGFDSWTAVLVDFVVVVFLFGLQYFMQRKNKTSFPSGELSRIVGVVFPETLNLNSETPVQSNFHRQLLSIQPKEELFLEGNQKIILPLKIINQENESNSETIHIDHSGFYLMQLSILTDKLDYNAKFSIVGEKNNIDKSIRHGENSFVIYVKGKDEIHFEIENGIHPAMILNQSSIYFVEL